MTMTITKMKTIGIVSIALILAATVVGAVAYLMIPAPARPQFEQAKNPVGENAPRPAEKKENGETKPPTLADRFHALVAARSAGVARWSEKVAAAQTDADRAAIKPWTDDEYSRKMWVLVVEATNDPMVPEILCRIVVWKTWSDSTPLALRRLHRDHVRVGRSLLLDGDLIFMINDGGMAGCVDARTGKQIKQLRLAGVGEWKTLSLQPRKAREILCREG